MIQKRIQIGERDACADLYLINPSITRNLKRIRPLMIICPGGGYVTLAHREAEPVALKFNGLGFDSIVFRYPVNSKNSVYPEPLLALFQLLDIVKKHAKAWYVDLNQLYLVGFSAGAHLIGLYANLWFKQNLLQQAQVQNLPKAKAAILGYPLIADELDPARNYGDVDQSAFYQALFGTTQPTQKQVDQVNLIKLVNEKTIPQFIWCTADDQTVDPAKTTVYVHALQKYHRKVEYHLFMDGGHGQALGDFSTSNPDEKTIFKPLSLWLTLAMNWLQNLKDKPHFEKY